MRDASSSRGIFSWRMSSACPQGRSLPCERGDHECPKGSIINGHGVSIIKPSNSIKVWCASHSGLSFSGTRPSTTIGSWATSQLQRDRDEPKGMLLCSGPCPGPMSQLPFWERFWRILQNSLVMSEEMSHLLDHINASDWAGLLWPVNQGGVRWS